MSVTIWLQTNKQSFKSNCDSQTTIFIFCSSILSL